MRLNKREWALVGVSLLSVGLVLFLLAGTVRSDGPANATSGVAITERPTDQFRLTIDERGLRSDWRDGKDSGNLRLDVNDQGVKLDARSTIANEIANEPAARTGECRCSCARCDAR